MGEREPWHSVMDKAFEILKLLNDGRMHSGADIASSLGITRGAVWNRIQRLQARGVSIFGIAGKGYRLPHPFDFLDGLEIEAALTSATRRSLQPLDIALITDSTNQQLLQRATHDNVHGVALFAEYQTDGRGRRGDRWTAPPGSGLCLSLGWRFDAPPSTMSALSLVIGIAVVRTVQSLGVATLALKWPNDVMFQGRKLAGILIEMRSEYGGPSTVVIGVGLNCRLEPDVRTNITQPVADLSEAVGTSLRRNAIAASLLNHLVDVLTIFAREGFAGFSAEWARHDGLAERPVQLVLPDRTIDGIARGVDPSGMLMIEHDGQLERFLAGHVRLLDAA
ncbi:MAG: biotin--[acetyl-CoA-carboxylase] ligase [Gammaproteobacteria bacterium]|nr:biotin--[acetyl-CoA-carboxylase] ligase [Gammaproteobacteria bacterium]